MEMPECPVCLQNYDSKEIVPRVLSCGHSICQICIKQLPPQFPNTIRCPGCNQLVKNPAQGPSALPKNIDLLRIIQIHEKKSPQQSKQRFVVDTSPPHLNSSLSHGVLPRFWNEEVYSTWKDWVIQSEAIEIEVVEGRDNSIFYGKTMVSNRSFRKNQKVSLLPVICSSNQCSSSLSHCGFTLSYIGRIMETLNGLKENMKTEMGFLMKASLLQRSLCRVYGLWMNTEGLLFLVCERFCIDFPNVWNELRVGFISIGASLLSEHKKSEKLSENLEEKGDRMMGFAMVALKFCETVMGLHSEAIVSGCLAPFCFSFDGLDGFLLDLNNVLLTGRRLRQSIRCIVTATRINGRKTDTFTDSLKTQTFVSPEVFTTLLNEESYSGSLTPLKITIGYRSDVWSLACILLMLLFGDSFMEEHLGDYYRLCQKTIEQSHDEYLVGAYKVWMEKLASATRTLLGGQYEELQHLLCNCLEYEMGNRPHMNDIWICIKGLLKSCGNISTDFVFPLVQDNIVCCLVLGDMCSSPMDFGYTSQRENGDNLWGNDCDPYNLPGIGLGEIANHEQAKETVDKEIVGWPCLGNLKTLTLQGHHDCITCLAVGGGFLVSSSFDKTVNVWSLQDFSHVRSLRGHEHRVMAVLVVDTNEPLCITGDSGGVIFVWALHPFLGEEPLKKWHEHKDWRYSGVHALAVSETEYLYSGSGDKSIKAWSLKDYTLACTMSGHNSVVSSLAARDGILYSGSWDGTIRLWWLNDHSPLAVLGDGAPGTVTSVLSLSVDHHILVASYENGCVKIWRHDVLMKSLQIHDGAVLALDVKDKFLFMGGWNKTINVQELVEDECQVDTRPVGVLTCNSVITSLLCFQGKIFAGYSDKVIKVYHHG